MSAVSASSMRRARATILRWKIFLDSRGTESRHNVTHDYLEKVSSELE